MCNKYFHYLISTILFCLSLISCKKFVEVPSPSNVVVSDQVFSNDNKASAAIAGMYSAMMSGAPTFSSWMTTIFAGSTSDELLKFNPSLEQDQFVTNQLRSDNGSLNRIWTTAYKVIYYSSIALENIPASSGMSEPIKKRLTGDCKFVRAFAYFYLVNLFGDVPLVLSSDFAINKNMARTDKELIYQSIVKDLTDAKELLSDVYYTSTKGRPNKWAATALLARVYLFMKDWGKAEQESTEVISSEMYTPLVTLSNVFLANNKEAIWQLVPDPNILGYIPEFLDAYYFPQPAPGYYFRNEYVNSFESGDQRRTAWIDSVDYSGEKYYYPGKYKDLNFINAEYYVVLRAAEQFLIRAEAKLWQNKPEEAIADVNVIRERAGLPEMPLSLTEEQITMAINQERKAELFAEWGHRWMDLKRTGKASQILSAIKGGAWQNTDQLWPIPFAEIVTNIQLRQNPGYE